MSPENIKLVLPADGHNLALLSKVRPADYVNPTPSGRYNLVVLGGGSAGLATAVGAAGLGAKVALVEKHLLGGDRLNAGCIPSKALLRSARAVAEIRDAEQFGVKLHGDYEVDFPAVMDRMRRLRSEIAGSEGVAALTKQGIDVFIGGGKFVDSETIDVNGAQLKFARAVIATGTRAALPPIPGIDKIDYLTNENLFWLTKLPKRLAVIGAGTVGSEMAQAFARFGCKVVLYDISPEFMPKEDPDAAAILKASLTKDGVDLRLGVREMRFSNAGDEVQVKVLGNSGEQKDSFDRILLSAGRMPNIEELNLGVVKVKCNEQGIVVNDRLSTTNSRIFACGDVASEFKFTHAADALSRIVIGNALFFATHNASQLNIPTTIYTDPEIAHVGVYGDREENENIETIQLPLSNSDRAVLDSQDDGLIKIHHDKRGTIKGATIVAAHASELIGEIIVAMNHSVRLGDLASDIHPYPTVSELIKVSGDSFRKIMLTPSISKFLKKMLSWRR